MLTQDQELHETQQKLKESLSLYENLYEHAPAGYFSIDEKGRIFKINMAGCLMLGKQRTRILDRLFISFLTLENANKFQSYLDSLSIGVEDARLIELEISLQGEKTCTILLESSPLIMGGRHIVMTDICQIKEAAQRNNELLHENRLLTKNLFKQQEEDSKYLAREIHDELGQWMSAILSQAEVLSTYGDKSDINQIAAKDISKSVGKMHEVVRSLMGHLRPAALDILGLTESLSKLMEDWCFQHPNVKLDQHIDDEFKDVSELVRIAVYRITQEAFTNISKYAHAIQVTVSLAHNEDNVTGAEYLTLIIEDNGRGFDPTQKSNGIGVVGMRERVVTLGGEFNMTSSPGIGTQISVKIPIQFQ